MRKNIAYIFTLLAILILTACGSSSDKENSGSNQEDKETILIEHRLDNDPVEVSKNPEKIVVFDYGMLDTLDKMGIEVVGVPKGSTIPPYLSKYEDAKYENIGSLKEPDFEKIAEIDPDLIIISGRQAELYEEFKGLAPTIDFTLDTSDYINSFKNNVLKLGKIFDQEEFINDELAKIDERIESAKADITALGKNALIVLANEGKVSAYGPGSRFGLIHDVLGFEAADPNIEVSTHGQSISYEFILETNPDYLFVIDRTAVVGGDSNAKEMVENDLVAKTTAYKEGNIIYLDPNYWYLSGGGLVSVSEMISEIEESIK